ncbi:hypothetical protein FQR65_LT06174 [Abscondita terminalis]|nr:hypothetical protein FQR65_LT06174 [Abscondita terminalis]
MPTEVVVTKIVQSTSTRSPDIEEAVEALENTFSPKQSPPKEASSITQTIVVSTLPGLVEVAPSPDNQITTSSLVTEVKPSTPTKIKPTEHKIEEQLLKDSSKFIQKTPKIQGSKQPSKDINTQFLITERQTLYQQEPNREISLHLTETTGKPEVIESEPERHHSIEFNLSLEEKQPQIKESIPKVSMTMKVEDNQSRPAEILQKDIYVSLPKSIVTSTDTVSKVDIVPEQTLYVSEVDHGGTKSRKKKKHKDTTSKSTTPDESSPEAATSLPPDELKQYSIETSLAESTDIIIPDDSEDSAAITPKFTEEALDVITPEQELSDGTPKDTGYEPEDKTTVDENLVHDDDQDKKKRRKKRKKQKVKVKDSEESYAPKSLEDSSPAEPFSDDEPYQPLVSDEVRKEKKIKHKKRGEKKVSEPSEEPVEDSMSEVERQTKIYEAHSDEIRSPNDSYRSMLTPSEADSVKIIEEGFPTPPETESLESITTKIVTTVPVIEAVITQEETAQTSPDLSEIKTEVLEPTVTDGHKVVETEQIYTQTSPETAVEAIEISLQTSPEIFEPVEAVLKPETVESSSQVELVVSENITQTSTPEEIEPVKIPETEIITTETSAQTSSPKKVEVIEQIIQTVTPEPEAMERSDSQMQTADVPLREEYAQTITPDVSEVQTKETLEFSTQIYPYEVSEPNEEYSQTSPVPSAPPLDEITQTSTPELHISPKHKSTTTLETTVQTRPVVVKEIGEGIQSPPTSRDQDYEVHVQAFVSMPETPDKSTSSSVEVSEPSVVEEDVSDNSASDSEDFDVEVKVDGKPVSFSSVTEFLEGERGDHKKCIRKKRKKGSSKHKPGGAHIKKELFEHFKPSGDALLDPSLLYSEIVKRGSRSSSPVPEQFEPIVVPSVDLQQSTTFEDVQRRESSPVPEQFKPIAILTVDSQQLKTYEDVQRQPYDSTIVNVSLTIPQESSIPSESSTPEEKQIVTPITSIEVQPSEVLVTELRIDTGDVTQGVDPTVSKNKKATKQKTKGKHKTSVTIEEVMSPEIVDTPLTPGTDVSTEVLSPVWSSPVTTVIRRGPVITETVSKETVFNDKWNQAQALERFKNIQNIHKTTHLSEVLLLASLDEVVTNQSAEEKTLAVQDNLHALRSAIHKGDVTIVQQTIITTVEIITTWLQTIEYRIYIQRQQTADGPSRQKLEEFSNLKHEITNIESNVKELESALADTRNIYNEDERERMNNYVQSLKSQLKVIEEVAQQNEQIVADDLARWQQFTNGLENISLLVNGVKKQFNSLIESDASPQTKLQELDELETLNRSHMLKTVHLIATARGLMRDFPNREIPLEVYTMHEVTKQIDHHITVQREKALHLLALAEEYDQTLKEFEQIIEIADALVESPISVCNLEHLEEEVQNHRKFFINLSHCRAILESLEENLDSETRALHSPLHQKLYERASLILDRAAGRLQQMSLAASRWTVLEQGMKEENRWLEVAKGRVPDLNNVTSVDYDQYINLYQSLSLDISHHQSKLAYLNNNAHKLQELVSCAALQQTYTQPLETIMELHEDVTNKLKRLISFRDSWNLYNLLSDKLEYWLKSAEQDLCALETLPHSKIPTPGSMRQFWELKAQHEVNNNTRMESGNALEKSMQIIPVADEMLQRKFHSDLQNHWQTVSKQINDIQAAITENISAPDIPINEKLILLQQELEELKSVIDSLSGVIKNEEELNLYVERLQIMQGRVETIQNELGRLGLLSAIESEKVGHLLALSKNVEIQIAEELDGSVTLKDRLQAIQRGLARVRRYHDKSEQTLNQCESCEKLGSDVVEKAVHDCTEVGEELVTLWQDLMGLRQLLHTLPMRLRVTVSPIKVEREISQLQDEHTALEKRCGQLLALLRGRLGLWQRFEKQLELVQRSVQEADFMMELFTVQGQVDYERLRKATERLEGLSGDFVNRETLLEELRSSAEPLASSCTPEVSAHVEAAVTEAVTAWEDTCTNLRELCTRYHNATELWKQYHDATDLIREWCDTQMESVNGLEPEETIKAVKVCEETLAAHTSRLAELRNLVTGIATAVGLDGNALLGGEVDALGRRLQDVRESLTTLADVADAQALSKKKAQEDFVMTKNYLTTVQKNLSNIQSEPESDLETKLGTLRDHLLQLSKAENTIQKIRDNSLDASKSTRTESSVIEILQLWQQVFRETFQQYHRLSTRLVKNEDSVAALKLWHEYLVHVQQFLLGSIPSEYNSLAEHQRLLEMHQNLLTTQQSILQPIKDRDRKLLEVNIAEQLNTLTNLHNETLAKIIERLAEVKNRLSAWENYRFDQSRLLSWLKDMEKEREHLQLRYIHIKRVPKILLKIQHLLTEIPHGEEQAEQLQKQQAKLLRFNDDAFSASIRMEHVAISQRISNLQAGLETWKQFLEKIAILIKTYDDRVSKIQKSFNVFQETINANSADVPSTHSSTAHKLEVLRQTRNRLNELTKDLEQLGVTQEQLKECVSPMDMKTISQQMWILWHQQADLEHQLTTLCHQLEERLGLRSTFEARHSRFILWIDNLEKRLDEEHEEGDPSEALKKLETELQTEMSLKNHEYNWLRTTGELLVRECGEEYSDVVAKQNLQAKTDEVRKRWEGLEKLGKIKISKIQGMTKTMLQLELRIAEIKSWLHQTETQLNQPLVFRDTSEQVIDSLTRDHDALKKSIEKESNIIGEVINLWEFLLSDSDVWRSYFETENISTDIQNIEKRWKIVCGKSAERKQKISFIWKLLIEVLRLCSEQEKWLTHQENRLKDLDKPVDSLSKDQLIERINKVDNVIKEIESRTPTYEILDQTYSKLVKTSGTDPENMKTLTSHVRQLIIKWHDILPYGHRILQVLERELALYKEFATAHGNAVMSLTRINAQLTELQYLSCPDTEVSLKERLEKLEAIDQDLTNQNPVLENADKLGLLIMQKKPKQEISKVQEMIDEYQLLWKDIQERIVSFRTELKNQRKEVDECVQVETLKFEQDTAVQVNTLPPQLQRLTSITPKDAYMVELTSAIGECTSNVSNLEKIVEKDIPQQGSSELHLIAKRIANLLLASQSSTELMNHLRDVLVNECDANDEEARTVDVESLTRRFTNLVAKAKQREAKIRELSEAGRLLCPLCTKRNWAQLDNDLWRLEQWLQAAEGIQSSQHSPPSNIEALEDVIQDHREFLLDLESHKSIIRSLNIVGTHLADHAEDTEKADKLRERLGNDNKRWDSVCINAASWQTVLQKALMDNRQFHAIVEELCAWLEKTESQIRISEPIDLTVDTETINNKFERFCLLKTELEHCEPRVLSLQENANELLRHEKAPEGSITICTRLNELRLKLHSLIRLTRVYVLKLGAVLGRDPNEIGLGYVSPPIVAGPSLQTLNYDVSLINRCTIL